MKHLIFALALLMCACKANPPATSSTDQTEVDTSFMSNVEAEKPMIDGLSAESIQKWNKLPIEEWNKFFGVEPDAWNPLQMKFYEDIKLGALSEEEKQALAQRTHEEWEAAFGGTIDTWKIYQLLFYSAILNSTID